tara:strand:- start:12202 stop:13560 length:1359 start_codon:yes stop_codon:yes gene_type:complete
MMEVLVSIVGFIIAIGILVTFHEFGHYYVARLCNVKVLNFSIGFGKNIYTKKFKGNDTEYSIGLIPLGGYVKMLESSELTEKHSDLKFCFDKQNVYKRFLIVAAGPIFNLILAIIFFTFVHFKGISGIKPIVTSIDSIHNSGTDLQVDNMEIYKVNDEYTKRWQDVRIQILNSAVDKEPITLYLRDNSNKDFSVNLSINYNEILKKEGDIIRNLGIQPRQPNLPPIIGSVQTNSPASLAGLEAGDIIKTINDKTIESWLEWVQIIKNNPNQELEIVLLRNNQEQKTLLIPVAKEVNKTTFGFAGVSADTDNLDQHRVIVSYPFFSSIHHSFILTYQYSLLTLKMIYKLFTGQANLKNISGPISIAEYTGKSLSMGLVYFAYILAILSISLGVLNLLPIPMLDGGHLMFYLFEIVTGNPISERIQLAGQQIGIIILFGIMILAFYNDFLRLLS